MAAAAGCNVTWPMLGPDALSRPLAAVGDQGVTYAMGQPRPPLSPAQLATAAPRDLAMYYAPIYVQGYGPTHEHKDSPYHWSHDDDSIGRATLERKSNGKLVTRIDVAQPTVYVIEDQRRLGDNEHLQLTYVVWYPRRPRTKKIDIEAAEIDSGVVRITLDRNHQPIFYETVLACGCYHKVFVESRVEAAARAAFGQPESGKKFVVEKSTPYKIDWEVAGVVDTPAGPSRSPCRVRQRGRTPGRRPAPLGWFSVAATRRAALRASLSARRIR